MKRRLIAARNGNNSRSQTTRLNDPMEKSLTEIQLKIMDGIRPLLHLKDELDRLGASRSLKRAASTALSLVGNAFSEVTKRRRLNVLRQTDGRYVSLLEEKDRFSVKEGGDLFGRHFLRSMVRTAREEENLRSMSRSGGHNIRAPSNFNRGRAAFGGRPSGRFHSSGRGGNYPGGGSIDNQRGRYSPINLFPCSHLRENVYFAGRPRAPRVPFSPLMDPNQLEVCRKELSEMLGKGAVVKVGEADRGFVSGFFVISKSSGGLRPIANLKHLNQFLVYRKFKMEGIANLKELILGGEWFTKIDLKDAYFSIPVNAHHQPFLQILFEGQIFQFTCLPFGLASAPWAFTKVLKPVVSFLRGKGVKLIVYLDDFLIISSGKIQAERDFLFTVELLEAVGFVINRAKSSGVPSQSREFLGLVVDSRSLTLSLKKDKVEKMVGSCRKMLSLDKVSLWDLSSLIGNFSWAISAVPFAQAHYRSLQHRFLVESRLSDLSAKILLDIESKSDLACSDGFSDITIFADASLIGWGAVCDKSTAQGPWTLEEKPLHINHLELLAALYALQCFTARATRASVLIYSDNSTAVAYINRCGGTWSRSLSATAKSIVDWCEPRHLSLKAVHLAGNRNMVADYQSRVFLDRSDWKLSEVSFRQINSRWKMEVDLFAAAWSSQLVKFASWQPQPGAWAVNAFTFSWKNLRAYAFPPFNLILRCISKVRKELADLVLVTPYWPSQRRPGSSASNRSSADIGHRRDPPADEVEIPHLSRLETLGRRFREQGLSEEVAQLLLDGNRQSTSAFGKYFKVNAISHLGAN
ncbi:reverse transcriptase [Daphnia sinensis]|uniref:Reverse transcriptase n=1 Tax=Daphnia sinensis TaxID=1820382 RepID=A0AAD5KWI3_9CRUS|nr:reverse transcriptase [Daphnia sinensis]